MPLDKSCSLDAFKSNVRASYKDGKRAQGTQHVAIAISTLKRACGVADDDRKMTPKDIVAAGAKGESRTYVSLFALLDKPGIEVGSGWFQDVATAARGAVTEAERGKRGRSTDELLTLVRPLIKTTSSVRESLHLGADWGPWLGWVSRMMYASENVAVPELAALIREYARGGVTVPISERRLDFAVRSSPHGGATSPSSAPPESNSGANAGTFRVFADDGEIKSGDGRAPKKRKR